MIGFSLNKLIYITYKYSIFTFSNSPMNITSLERFGIRLKASTIIKNTIIKFDFKKRILGYYYESHKNSSY
jgi:hypothetical protein